MIRSRINQYNGVNAHFQSYAQWERDGWSSFHGSYIGYLLEVIDALLPPGYEATMERSLQIRISDPIEDSGLLSKKKYPEPDITIWDKNPSVTRAGTLNKVQVATPTAIDPLLETLERYEEIRIAAIAIREINPDGLESYPVTRLELLSPTNKVDKGATIYLTKRDTALEAGTVLVEIDFLHETDSPIPGVPGYASREPGAYPYMITVSIPRPTAEAGQRERYGFGIEEKILPIRVPLSGDESIIIDFEAVYNRTFSAISTYYTRANYAKEPLNFHAYTPVDRKRIWLRMLVVLDAVRAGKDLSQAPFPLPENDLAFAELEKYPCQNATLLIDEKTLDAHWLIHTQNQELLLLKRTIENGQVKVDVSKLADGTQQDFTALKIKFEQTGSFT